MDQYSHCIQTHDVFKLIIAIYLLKQLGKGPFSPQRALTRTMVVFSITYGRPAAFPFPFSFFFVLFLDSSDLSCRVLHDLDIWPRTHYRIHLPMTMLVAPAPSPLQYHPTAVLSSADGCRLHRCGPPVGLAPAPDMAGKASLRPGASGGALGKHGLLSVRLLQQLLRIFERVPRGR